MIGARVITVDGHDLPKIDAALTDAEVSNSTGTGDFVEALPG